MDDFQAATDRFLAWFKSMGGEFREDLLEIRDLRATEAGRGIVAIKDIPEDTTLFSIPRSAIINIETSEVVGKLPKVFAMTDDDNEDWEPLDSWGSLILIMLYEYLQGDASKWKPYFDVLPQKFDTPIFWTADELKELKGTCLTPEKIGKQEIDEALRSRLLPIVAENSSIFYPEHVTQLSEDELLTLAHRIGGTIMAYAFELEDGDEDSDSDDEDGWTEDRERLAMFGMVPMADMLNSNADFNAHVNHGDSLEVTALRSRLSAGSEILNYYGPLPSSELLRRYGYVTPEHRRYDVVELPWAFVRSALAQQLNLTEDVLDKVDAELNPEGLEDYFIIERDSGEPDGQGRLVYNAQLREVSAELDEQLTAFLKAIKKSKPDAVVDKRKRVEACKAAISQALTKKLTEYDTCIEEDQALLKKDGLSRRHRMAIEVRLGEKLLLQEALALIPGSESNNEASNGRAPKRARTNA
ncbi:Ribosomal lysine N-methyltransferase 4 [Pleosporales sp. CAS-2024a]